MTTMIAGLSIRSWYSRGVKARIVLMCAIVLAVGGCGGSQAADGRTSVVAAFYPLAYAAEQVGGPSVVVRNLTPPGAEPHDVELAPRDVEAVRSADVVLFLGGGFQPAVERAATGARGAVIDLLPELGVGGDPHVWLDPVRYGQVAGEVGRVLGRPSAALRARTSELDTAFRVGLEHCERRELVTSHASFGYLARRYSLDQVALTGLAPEADPSAKRIEELVRKVRATKATTVFAERLVSPELAQTVAREAGATVAILDPIEGLSGVEAARGEDYFSLMRENLVALRRGLGCR